jgi:ribosomal protein S27E
MRNKQEKEKEKKFYKFICGYCKFEFNQRVGIFNHVTSQVICPKCKNFLKSDSGI